MTERTGAERGGGVVVRWWYSPRLWLLMSGLVLVVAGIVFGRTLKEYTLLLWFIATLLWATMFEVR